MVTVIYKNGDMEKLNNFDALPEKGGLYAFDDEDFFYSPSCGGWVEENRRDYSFLVSPPSPFSIRRKSDGAWWGIFDRFVDATKPGRAHEFITIQNAKAHIKWHKLQGVEISRNHAWDVL